MDHIETYAKFSIHQGQLANFKSAVEAVVNVVKERDPGTLRYDWFINESKMECVAMDTYIDAASMYAHQANAGKYMSAVLQCSDMCVEFLGLPCAEALEKIKKFNPRLFQFHSGLDSESAALKFTAIERQPDSRHIEIFTRFSIEPVHFGVFKKAAAELLEVVVENDPGTVRYDWFYDDQNYECIAMDTYADAAGMFAHMKNAHEKHSELLQYSSVFTEFLGAIPAEAMSAVEKYSPNIMPFYTGLKSYSSGGF